MTTNRFAICLLALVPGAALAGDYEFFTEKVRRGDVVKTIIVTGTIEPKETVEVGAQLSGQIIGFGAVRSKETVDFGSRVEAGAVLARIDAKMPQLKVDQAIARLRVAEAKLRIDEVSANIAKSDFERAQRLLTTRAVSREEFDAITAKHDLAKAHVDAARATVEQAKLSVKEAEMIRDTATIRSPITGVVIDRRVNIGQTVVAGVNAPSLFLIADLRKMHIWATVPEADIGLVRRGQAVSICVDALPTEKMRGTVDKVRLNAALNNNSVNYTATIDVENFGPRVLPYMTAEVRIVAGERPKVLLVPNTALKWRPSLDAVGAEYRAAYRKELEDPAWDKVPLRSPRVWIIEKGKVKPVSVSLGLSDGVVTEILDGLRDGEAVVVDSAAILRPPSK
jgi:HlyD family secretion protein